MMHDDLVGRSPVISEGLARRNFPNEDPVGRRISFDEDKTF